MTLKIVYEDDDIVPYWDESDVNIVLTSNGKLCIDGPYTPNAVYQHRINENTTGRGINDMLNEIAPKCEDLLNGNGDEEYTAAEIDRIIDSLDNEPMYTAFVVTPQNMQDFFVNGETPEERADIVDMTGGMVSYDFGPGSEPVFFPYNPKKYM